MKAYQGQGLRLRYRGPLTTFHGSCMGQLSGAMDKCKLFVFQSYDLE